MPAWITAYLVIWIIVILAIYGSLIYGIVYGIQNDKTTMIVGSSMVLGGFTGFLFLFLLTHPS